MRKIIIGLVFAALIGAPGLGSSAYADDGTVKIGAVVSYSGYMAPYDVPPFQAALLAVDEINAKGGVLGKKIEVLKEDEKTDRALASRLAKELVGEGVQLMLVACDYDEGAPAALVAISANILAYSLCAADPKMGPQGLGSMAFSGSTGTGNQAYAMAEWAYKEKGWRNAYTLLDTSLEFHKGWDGFFKLAWKQLPGAKLVGADTFFQDDPSVASQITKIKALGNGIDVIVITSHTPGFASVIRQIRAAGIKTPIMTGDSLDGDYWISAVPDALPARNFTTTMPVPSVVACDGWSVPRVVVKMMTVPGCGAVPDASTTWAMICAVPFRDSAVAPAVSVIVEPEGASRGTF